METAAIMLFLVLPCVIAALAIGAGAMVLHEAFAPTTRRKKAAATAVSLPLLAGDALRRWASESARRIVSRYSAKRANGQAAVAMAQAIEAETSHVIERSLPSGAVAPEPQCSECSEQTIEVTVPEALAIVDELRQKASSRELERVRERAKANLQRMSAASAGASSAMLCPLLSDDNHCAVFGSRPLYCRGRCCPQCDLPGEPGANEEAEAVRRFAATFGEGVSAGFSQGLTSAGLDGGSYELNRALVQALDDPKTGDRWLRGERVFEACEQSA